MKLFHAPLFSILSAGLLALAPFAATAQTEGAPEAAAEAPAEEAVAAEAPAEAPAEEAKAAKKGDCASHCAKPEGIVIEKGPFALKIGAQLRARGIVDSSRLNLLDDGLFDREYVTQRARLGAIFSHEGGAAIGLQLQDSRVWGEELDTLNDFDANGLDLHEAYAVVPIYEKLKLKLGRQEIVFDNSRLVGNVGWVQRARSFDAARMTYARERFDLDLFYALVSETDTDGDGSVPSGADARSADVTFGGVHSNLKVAEGHLLSLAYYNRSDVPARHYRHTVGGYAQGKVAGLGYTGELFFQFGRNQDEVVSAWMSALHLSYGLEATAKPALELWFEYLSGDDGSGRGAFDTLYATNHKFYGEMDYFLNIPVHSGGLGLMDVGGRLSASPHAKLQTQVDLHLLGATAAPVGGGSSNFGVELDFKLIASISQKVGVRFLYGIFLPGDGLAAVKGVDQADLTGLEHFAYLTVDLKL
ncbi:MAG: alginate export family protein [Deltaproteobacteria bacterium]|nr:alginate export family protein [Deltaproteobacteria bacterium]